MAVLQNRYITGRNPFPQGGSGWGYPTNYGQAPKPPKAPGLPANWNVDPKTLSYTDTGVGGLPAGGWGGGGGGGGPSFSIPDYSTLLNSDPMYQQALADARAQGISDQATYAAGLNRALVGFGAVPQDLEGSLGFANAFQGLDLGKARALAAQNTQAGTSTLARINEQTTEANRMLPRTMAASGMLQSGETGYQQGKINLADTRAQYDARQQLLDVISGAHGQLVAAQRAQAEAIRQAAMAAYQNQLQMIMAGLGAMPGYGYGDGGGGYGPPPTETPGPINYVTPPPAPAAGTGTNYGRPAFRRPTSPYRHM